MLSHYEAKVASLESAVEEMVQDEEAERLARRVEMEADKAENLLAHEDEIKNRPARQWFQVSWCSEEGGQKVDGTVGGLSVAFLCVWLWQTETEKKAIRLQAVAKAKGEDGKGEGGGEGDGKGKDKGKRKEREVVEKKPKANQKPHRLSRKKRRRLEALGGDDGGDMGGNDSGGEGEGKKRAKGGMDVSQASAARMVSRISKTLEEGHTCAAVGVMQGGERVVAWTKCRMLTAQMIDLIV